ncbi:MAG TPA: DUF4397 domain-containing protein [Terriglobales bacterium]|nr:DUF4397 domain-containing protein [Terriglobales bacterium]
MKLLDRWLLGCSVVALLMASGCGGGSSSSTRLRVLHASPNSVNFDILVDKSAFASGLGYSSVTGYSGVSSGSRQIQVEPTGTTNLVIDTTLNLGSSTDYTFMIAGLANSLSPVLLTDNNTAPSSGDFKIRFVHASPAAGPLDVYLTGPSDDLNTATPVQPSLSFKSASSYATQTAGTIRVRFTVAGSKAVLIDSGSLSLSAGQIRTVVALDAPGGGPPLNGVILADLN